MTNRLTLNLGFRYDLLTGFAIDQTKNPNFVKLQNAGGRRALRRPARRSEDFGKSSEEDKNNFQPRVGAVVRHARRRPRRAARRLGPLLRRRLHQRQHPVRRGRTPPASAPGTIFNVTQRERHHQEQRQLLPRRRRSATIASQNEAGGALPLNSHIASPRITQPYADQTSIGWSHQLDTSTVFDVDYVHSAGHDLGWRVQLNQRSTRAATTRQFADLGLSPANFTIDISNGKSKYDGVNFGVRRRMTNGLQFTAWYSLSDAEVDDRQRRPTS